MSTRLARSSAFWIAITWAVAVYPAALAAAADGFRKHAKITAPGSAWYLTMAPGPQTDALWLYAPHACVNGTLDLVAVDPLTGHTEVFPCPVANECIAWAIIRGPDDKVYLGTAEKGHVLRLDWEQKKLTDCGRPIETETYIWQFAIGTDKKLYGCTYPQAKLFRFDPVTGKSEDLGRMDPREKYARSVVADKTGIIYVGIGTAKAHLVAYEIATGRRKDILPAECADAVCCEVMTGSDGKIYGRAGGVAEGRNDKYMIISGLNVQVIPKAQYPGRSPLRLADGRRVRYKNRQVIVHDAEGEGASAKPVSYAGKPQAVRRLGLGPDGQIYTSTDNPLYFIRADAEGDTWKEVGQAGSGEVFSFLTHEDSLIMAAYFGLAPIMIYQPGKPFAPAESQSGNPRLIHYAEEDQDQGWHPVAMINGGEGRVFIGAIAGYGRLGGPLCELEVKTGRVERHPHVVQGQSVAALAALPGGLIAGGTTVQGGGGSRATQNEAKLFLWDASKNEKVFEVAPVPGQRSINALAVGPDGLLYGFAGPTMFAFDPKERTVLLTRPHGLGNLIANAIGPGPEGKLYGLSRRGIFTIDTEKREARMLARHPGGITAGFAISGRQIFFAKGPQIVSYTLP